MTLSLSVSEDFAPWVDGLESVTLRRRESGETVMIASALRRRAVTQEAEPSAGVYRRSDAVWHLQLPAGESAPQLGDVLVDVANERWAILQTEEQTLLGRWKCSARNLSVAFGLNDRVDFQRPQWDDVGEGPVIVGWSFVYTALPVRIQRDELAASGPSESPTSTARFSIFLGEPFPVTAFDRLVAADGTTYQTESIEQTDRIDVLPVVRAVRV